MKQRPSCKLFITFLLLTPFGAAQTPAPMPVSPPQIQEASPQQAVVTGLPPQQPQAKEMPPETVGAIMENIFGKESAELKRPIRMWIASVGVAIAAEKSHIPPGGSTAQFIRASVGVLNQSLVLRGEQVNVGASDAIVQLSDLQGKLILVEIQTKVSTVKLSFTGLQVGHEPLAPPLPLLSFVAPMDIRFSFKIAPATPLSELLPALPKTSAKLPAWTNEDLSKVPELTFGEPIARELPKHDAMEKTAHVIAKINHLNHKKADGFMLAMIEQRPDLRGLPFLMGDQCRTPEEQATTFRTVADSVNAAVKTLKANPNQDSPFSTISMHTNTLKDRVGQERYYRALVAALMQVVMPEAEQLRVALANFLATIPNAEATRALANLAIFSPEEAVRTAAIQSLKLRREQDYSDVLVQTFRYPLPAVSKRAAEALVKLERKDLLAKLVEVLESPDPRLPVTEKRDGKEVTVVRELVRVNHHRNCLLCHAPGNTDNTPAGVLKVAVPLPGEPLSKPSDGGGYQSTPPPTPDIVVRIDMTYLRQDFSQMMPVSDAHPWPAMQRFDFLVRTRTLTPAEAQAYEPCCEEREPGRLSPYHRAALFALRELTGRDTEPTAPAWRKLLQLAAR